jgi:polo-like kinase 1
MLITQASTDWVSFLMMAGKISTRLEVIALYFYLLKKIVHSAGVYFNDSTKAVLSSDGKSFIYVERRKILDTSGEKTEQIPEIHSLEDYPTSLEKKVTLLKHFRNYLIEQRNRDESTEEEISPSSGKDASMSTIFLKKWVRTKHAILFRLSNQTVQVVFYDHTEILLTSEARTVTFVNKRRERETYFLDDIMAASDHADIKKRLKYAEGILSQLCMTSPKK